MDHQQCAIVEIATTAANDRDGISGTSYHNAADQSNNNDGKNTAGSGANNHSGNGDHHDDGESRWCGEAALKTCRLHMPELHGR